MAVPESVKLDSLIQESETLKFKFEYAIQPHNLEAFFKSLFFELSPREQQIIPDFSTFDRKIQFFDLIAYCITEVNENIFRLIETDEHVRRYLQGVWIKIEQVQRKICCFFIGNLTENDLTVRLSDGQHSSLFESMTYLNRANIPKDPNAQNPAEREFVGRNPHNSTLISHLHLTLNYVGQCYHIEIEFERLRRHVLEQMEKYSPATKQKNEIKNSITNSPANYCIPMDTITKLYSLLIRKSIIEQMQNPADFFRCFDLANSTNIHPVPIDGKTKYLVYALSLVSKNDKPVINDKIALNHFGLKAFRSIKSQTALHNPITDDVFIHDLKKILT